MQSTVQKSAHEFLYPGRLEHSFFSDEAFDEVCRCNVECGIFCLRTRIAYPDFSQVTLGGHTCLIQHFLRIPFLNRYILTGVAFQIEC